MVLSSRRPSEEDLKEFLSRRQMTRTQERWNALTMLPFAVYTLWFVWTEEYQLHGSWSEPPHTVLAIMLGAVVHVPYSFLYHWTYAHSFSCGLQRMKHWSRRMDHAMIHVASALFALGTSGRWDYFALNAIWNFDCAMKHWETEIHPWRNQVRILISVFLYTLPMLYRATWQLWLQAWGIVFISFTFFGLYPIGGWSHSAFHILFTFLAPTLLQAALLASTL